MEYGQQAIANTWVSSFSNEYGGQGGLHTFPTRRSSDLRSGPPARRRTAPEPGRGPRSAPRRSTTGRSEEHTSELQSRENLVCRLLLEKKNEIIAIFSIE